MTQVIVIKEAVENKKTLTFRIPKESLGKIQQRVMRLARFSIPSSVLFVHENQPVYIHIENSTTNVSSTDQIKSCTFMTNPANVSAQSVEYASDYAVEIPKSVKEHTSDMVIHVRSLLHDANPVILPSLSTFSSVVLECNGNVLTFGEHDVIPYGRYDAGIFAWRMMSDLVEGPSGAYSTDTVMFTQSHGTSFSNIAKVFSVKYDSSEADACFLQLRPHMCNCKLTSLHVEYRMQEYPPQGMYSVADMNTALHQSSKWNVMTFQEILDSYPASTLLPILTGTLTIDDNAKSGEIHVDTPTVKCPKCAVSGRWSINTCTGFLIRLLGLTFPPAPPTDASFQLCTSRIVSTRNFGLDKRDRATVSCTISSPFWITDSFWLSAYQHSYKKKAFVHDWRIRCAHAPTRGVTKVVDRKVRASAGLAEAATLDDGLGGLLADAEFVEHWNDARRLYEYHVSVRTVVQPFSNATTCILILNGERVLACSHPIATMQMNVIRLEAQKAELERVVREHAELQRKVRELSARVPPPPTNDPAAQELTRLKQDPLYTMSVVAYEKECESVDRSLQTTMASVRQLATTDWVFEVVWSSAFYTTRFDLAFESLHANVRTPHVAMSLSMYVEDTCLGSYQVNDACSTYEFVCNAPFLAKKVVVKCGQVREANWRIVSVSPVVLSSAYELDHPVRLWGATRHDARCMLLQTSPDEMEMPIDMCPVHAEQAVNSFPILCPHKPNINSYLWFLDSSASWMLVPYKRNASHLDDRSSSVLQIGIYLT